MSQSLVHTKPRICLLVGGFYPIVGGGETHARMLAETLIGMGVKVFVLTRRRSPSLAKKEIVGTIPVYRIPPSGRHRFGKYLMFLPALLQLFKARKDYDIIFVSNFRALGIIAVLAAKLYDKKCVLRAGISGELSGEYALFGSKILNRSRIMRAFFNIFSTWRKALLKKADVFISISEEITKEFEECGVPSEKIYYIPNVVDTNLFKPVSAQEKLFLRAKLSIPVESNILTYAGRLGHNKGLKFLLESWKRIVQVYPTAYLLFVGSGEGLAFSTETELRNFVVGNALGNNVGFTGYVDNVHEYLQASDFFVLPSESGEGFPNALLEALACGLPAVSTELGGIVDIINDGENGLLVKPGNTDELHVAITSLFSDKKRVSSLGRKGRITVKERFSVDSMAESHLNLLLSLNEK